MCFAEKIENYQRRAQMLSGIKSQIDGIGEAIANAVELAYQIPGEHFPELVSEIGAEISKFLTSAVKAVESPSPSEAPVELEDAIAPVAEPKKRGRRKKEADAPQQEEPDAPPQAETPILKETQLAKEIGLSESALKARAQAAFKSGELEAFISGIGWDCVQFPRGENQMQRRYWPLGKPIPATLESEVRDAFAKRFGAIAEKKVCEIVCSYLFEHEDMTKLSFVQLNKMHDTLINADTDLPYLQRKPDASSDDSEAEEAIVEQKEKAESDDSELEDRGKVKPEEDFAEKYAVSDPNTLRREAIAHARSLGLTGKDVNEIAVQNLGKPLSALNAAELERLPQFF